MSGCTFNSRVSAVASLLSGCERDLPLAPAPRGIILQLFQLWYYPAREVGCLRQIESGSSGPGRLCVIETLQAIEKLSGQPLSLGYLKSIDLPNLLSQLTADAVCTPCIRVVDWFVRGYFCNDEIQPWEKLLSDKCGSNFTAGPLPTSVVLTAGEIPSGAASNDAIGMVAVVGTALLGVAAVVLIVL
ncbi:hypothetical protein RhiJN_16274 [Ceratobasidium sp. AG-Ba]|nr:hypothetical protein RhiJN_16274 [Ceratobasidium sp. AG-Ba]